MIHQSQLIVRIRLPRSVDFDRTSRLAVGSVAQVRRDTAVFPFELLDRVEGRVAREKADGRIQSAARKQQQRKAGASLLVVDADRTLFEKLAPVRRLLSK